MQWINQTGAEYSVYTTRVGDRTYEIRKKKGFGLWRLFIRETPDVTQRTIFTGDTLKSCKAYTAKYERAYE